MNFDENEDLKLGASPYGLCIQYPFKTGLGDSFVGSSLNTEETLTLQATRKI